MTQASVTQRPLLPGPYRAALFSTLVSLGHTIQAASITRAAFKVGVVSKPFLSPFLSLLSFLLPLLTLRDVQAPDLPTNGLARRSAYESTRKV